MENPVEKHVLAHVALHCIADDKSVAVDLSNLGSDLGLPSASMDIHVNGPVVVWEQRQMPGESPLSSCLEDALDRIRQVHAELVSRGIRGSKINYTVTCDYLNADIRLSAPAIETVQNLNLQLKIRVSSYNGLSDGVLTPSVGSWFSASIVFHSYRFVPQEITTILGLEPTYSKEAPHENDLSSSDPANVWGLELESKRMLPGALLKKLLSFLEERDEKIKSLRAACQSKVVLGAFLWPARHHVAMIELDPALLKRLAGLGINDGIILCFYFLGRKT